MSRSDDLVRRSKARHFSPMEWTITIAVIVVALGLTLFASWKSGRPRKDSLRAQWISWPLMTVVGGTVLIFGVVHALNLMGIHTGRDQVRGPPGL